MKFCALFALALLYDRGSTAPCNCGLGSGVDVCLGGGQLPGGGSFGGGVITGGGDGGGVSGGGYISGGGFATGGGYISGGDASGGGVGFRDCYPIAVRPSELPRIDLSSAGQPRVVYRKIVGPGNVQPFRPIGGLCTKGKTIVRPAILPRPNCASCGVGGGVDDGVGEGVDGGVGVEVGGGVGIGPGGPYGGGPSGSGLLQGGQTDSQGPGATGQISVPGLDKSITIVFPNCGNPSVQPSRSRAPGVPADRVTQDLVYRQLLEASQQYNKADKLIAQGFKGIPVQSKSISTKTRFDENQDILSFGGEVVEIQPISQTAAEDDQEEEDDDDDDDGGEGDQVDQFAISQPTYSDIGASYVKGNRGGGGFVNVDNAQAVPQPQEQDCALPLYKSCNDGFREGEVVIKEAPVYGDIANPRPAPALCGDGEGFYSSDDGSDQQGGSLLDKLGCA